MASNLNARTTWHGFDMFAVSRLSPSAASMQRLGLNAGHHFRLPLFQQSRVLSRLSRLHLPCSTLLAANLPVENSLTEMQLVCFGQAAKAALLLTARQRRQASIPCMLLGAGKLLVQAHRGRSAAACGQCQLQGWEGAGGRLGCSRHQGWARWAGLPLRCLRAQDSSMSSLDI